MTQYQSSVVQNGVDCRRSVTLFLVGDGDAGLAQLAHRIDEVQAVDVVGRATRNIDALAQISHLLPDVVLLDIDPSIINHRWLIQLLRAAAPDTKILVLAPDSVPSHILHTFWCGVRGYVLKESSSHEITDAIHALCNEHYYLDTHIELKKRVGCKLAGGE